MCVDNEYYNKIQSGILLFPEDESGESTQQEEEESEAGETDEQDTEDYTISDEQLERRR